MGVYLSLLLPITALIYATAAIGEEREQRTLVYLLSPPPARYRIYLAKAAGILPATVLVGLSGFWAICQTAGELGEPAWNLFFPAIARACLAYGALFLLFGAAFPRPAVLGVVYSLFVETTLGNMPGTIKRIAVSY